MLIDKRGKLLGKHRKINLLTEIEGSGLYSVGSKLEVFDTELGKLGIDICADNARSSMVLGEALCRMARRLSSLPAPGRYPQTAAAPITARSGTNPTASWPSSTVCRSWA